MIPDVALPEAEIIEQPSKTWRLNLQENRLQGEIDGLGAVLQAAFLALQTPRYRHLIYSRQYGSELYTLIGREREYALSEACRMISDALSTDTRITGVRDFREENGALCCTLDTIFGSVQLLAEVNKIAEL